MGVRRRSSPLLVSPSLLLFGIGVGFGLAVSMCLQSLACLPPQTGPRQTACRHNAAVPLKQRSRDVVSPPSASLPPHDSKELLLLVGVMTAQKYIDTRALTVWKTWARKLPGRVIFFVAEDTVISDAHSDMPIVRLTGADDVYPPQKKSFLMLRWMADNVLMQFSWFLRADDDLFIRGDRLEIFLRSINHNQPHFIGQAGRGTTEEYGTLSLADDENYCMGGPGIVFSREAMRLLQPHLAECLQSMYTSHEDVEIGRCVRRHVGITCTWGYEAITLHPLKAPSTMLAMQSFVSRSKSADLRFRHLQLSRDVLAADFHLASSQTPPPFPFLRAKSVQGILNEYAKAPSLLKFIPTGHSQILPWDFMSSSNILYCSQQPNCPRHNVKSYSQYAVNGAVRQIFNYFNRNARQRGRVLEFKTLQYGYRRVDPLHGVDYILDIILLFKQFRHHKATVSVRRHAYVQQGFALPHLTLDEDWRNRIRISSKERDTLRESETSILQTRINIILPLSGRVATLRRFADNFRSICLQSASSLAGPVSLIVVLFRSQSPDDDRAILSVLTGLWQTTHPTNDVRWIDLGKKPFSRGLALAEGSASVKASDGDQLLFFTDVDVIFTADALYRIRRNTIRGLQVFFPIVFSEYAPETRLKDEAHDSANPFQYERTAGYFRHFGFGIVSLYQSDLAAVGGLNTSIRGWGKEDVDLFEKCLNGSSAMRTLRATEPGLVHGYHPVVCDIVRLPPAQYAMCLGSRQATYGSVDSLARRANRPIRRRNRTQPPRT